MIKNQMSMYMNVKLLVVKQENGSKIKKVP